MNFEELIQDVYQKIKKTEDKGEMASYIPELIQMLIQRILEYTYRQLIKLTSALAITMTNFLFRA